MKKISTLVLTDDIYLGAHMMIFGDTSIGHPLKGYLVYAKFKNKQNNFAYKVQTYESKKSTRKQFNLGINERKNCISLFETTRNNDKITV